MAVLLNLFFNDYGLSSGKAWALFTIILLIICAIFMAFYMKSHDVDDDLPPTLILGGVFVRIFISIYLYWVNKSIRVYTYQWYRHPKG